MSSPATFFREPQRKGWKLLRRLRVLCEQCVGAASRFWGRSVGMDLDFIHEADEGRMVELTKPTKMHGHHTIG